MTAEHKRWTIEALIYRVPSQVALLTHMNFLQHLLHSLDLLLADARRNLHTLRSESNAAAFQIGELDASSFNDLATKEQNYNIIHYRKQEIQADLMTFFRVVT